MWFAFKRFLKVLDIFIEEIYKFSHIVANQTYPLTFVFGKHFPVFLQRMLVYFLRINFH